MSEEEIRKEGEATFAPGQDLSLESTEMLLEDIATSMFDAEIKELFHLHYAQILTMGTEEQVVECSSLDMAMNNAKSLLKSPSILPHSVKVTSQKIISTPETTHEIPVEAPPKAPRYIPPAEHPNIPTAP